MKILYTCGSHSWGGLEMQTLKTAKTMHERGHDVMLVVPYNSTLHKKSIEAAVPLLTLQWKNSCIIGNIFRLKKIIRNFCPEIIHTQLSHDLWTLSPALSKRSGVKLILSRRMASGISKKDFLHKLLYKKIDLLLCVSTFIRDNVIKTTPILPERVRVYFNGINLERFNSQLYNREHCRKNLNISSSSTVIGFLGRFTFMKGHYEFFEAAKILLEKHPTENLVFLVAGGDSFGEEEFGSKAREYGIQLLGKEHLIFTGDVTDTPPVLIAMDILAFPSHEESFGNVLCEAGALEIPVVASNSGGVPDIVVHEQTGILVDPKSSKALAEGLSYYILDLDKRKKHGKNASVFIKEKFAEQKQLQQLENIYSELLKNPVGENKTKV